MRDAPEDIDRVSMDVARLGERYTDYFLAVRTSTGRLIWRSSDKTWAAGVCVRYATAIDEEDRIFERARLLDRD